MFATVAFARVARREPRCETGKRGASCSHAATVSPAFRTRPRRRLGLGAPAIIVVARRPRRVVQASTQALQEVPLVNAFIDDETKEIVYRDFCDISVAVSSPAGLVVPVLRNTETMGLADVERSIGNYAALARDGKLAIEVRVVVPSRPSARARRDDRRRTNGLAFGREAIDARAAS